MQFDRFDIEGPLLFVPNQHRDPRGTFAETFREDEFAAAIGDATLVQENQSVSAPVNTIRGLHFQVNPHAQGKLVRVTHGAILDVAVDIRPDSPTFGKHIRIELSDQNWYQLWVPPGFAHGFYVTSETAEFVYKCSDYYHPQSEVSILWNDPALGIQWPLVNGESPALSEKDQVGCLFNDAPKFD